MTSTELPILAAVADAVHSATPEQLPLPEVPLRSRVLRRLPAGAVLTLGDVRDAAGHLRVVGLVRRDGDGWAPGLLSPEEAPVQPHHEALFWEKRRRAVEEGQG